MTQILCEQKQSFTIFLPPHVLVLISLSQPKYSISSEELLLILLQLIKQGWVFSLIQVTPLN